VRVSALIMALLLALTGCTAKPPASPRAVATDRVVGYFTDWGVYGRNYQVKNVETSGSAARLTHLVYAFGKVDGGRCAPSDGWADYLKPIAAGASVDGKADTTLHGNIGQLRELKARHPRLKVIWSFGGWTGSKGFADAARDPAAFAASCRDLVDDPRWAGVFDGIDVDWEYPNACGLGCDTSGKGALAALLGALRTAFGPRALITAAVPGDVTKLAATDYAAAARSADWLSAMTYDYFGTDGVTGPTAPHSPLTAYAGIPRTASTGDATVTKLLSLGVPAGKVLLGVGFYGRGWAGVSAAGPGGVATGPARGTYEKGVEDYRVLRDRCPPTGLIGGTAYAHCGDQWWGYDTPETIKTKMAYVRSRALGGAFAWELSGDTGSADLLTAMAGGLG
jgi:chitinase